MQTHFFKRDTKGGIVVRGEYLYNNMGMERSILKKGKTWASMHPNPLPIGIAVAEAKVVNVQNLLVKHFGAQWANDTRLQYYKRVIENSKVIQNVNTDVDDKMCEQRPAEENHTIDFV